MNTLGKSTLLIPPPADALLTDSSLVMSAKDASTAALLVHLPPSAPTASPSTRWTAEESLALRANPAATFAQERAPAKHACQSSCRAAQPTTWSARPALQISTGRPATLA